MTECVPSPQPGHLSSTLGLLPPRTLEELGDRQVASPETSTPDGGDAGGQDLPLIAIVAAALGGGALVAGGLWVNRTVRARRAAR